MLPMISATGYYQIAVGAYYDDQTSYTGSWIDVSSNAPVGVLARRAVRAQMMRTADAPFTAVKVANLTIPVPGVTKLAQSLTTDATTFKVANAAALNLPGMIYVGSEIMRADKLDNTTLRVVPLARDPASPGAPGGVQPLEQGKTSYALRWNAAAASDSGVIAYEVQERGGDPKDIAATVLWRSLNLINGRVPSYTVGDPKFPGEGPRTTGYFYNYRVRALSGGGVWSPWSPLGQNVNTGAVTGIITGVSNFPNPFDTRKGGPGGKTTITYTLNADSDVTITVYDLLGYVVKTMSYNSGSEGGMAGPNFVTWDGRNGSGNLVSKGGYVARIKVKSPGGSSEVIRKIGVVH